MEENKQKNKGLLVIENKLKLLVVFILTVTITSWGKHFLVVFDDGFTYRFASGCEVTIKGEDDEIYYSGYTNVHGRVNARNLQEGEYRVVLRIFNRRYEFDHNIEDVEGTDTLFIPGK